MDGRTRRAALRLAAGSLLGGLMARFQSMPVLAQDPCGGCPPGYVCRGGACVVVMSPGLDECTVQGLRKCGGVCVDPKADARNCGGCGVACAQGESCGGGRCTACAAQGLRNCGGRCVDLANDWWNCGACGNSCPIGSVCDRGRCVSSGYFCTTHGFTECDGHCVDTKSDPDYCGGCQFACYVEGARCVNGRCV